MEIEFTGSPMEGNFVRQFQFFSRYCTSVPVFYTTSILRFCLARLRKHPQPWNKMLRRNITESILHKRVFIMAMWPKICAKLSKVAKLTVESGRAFNSFLK